MLISRPEDVVMDGKTLHAVMVQGKCQYECYDCQSGRHFASTLDPDTASIPNGTEVYSTVCRIQVD